MTLSWAGGRRLASVSKEGLSASYVYNSDGIRTQKTVNGVTTNYYLDGNSILRQVTGNDVLEFFYDANGVLGFYYNNTPYYYLKNLQGDIVGILDANGTQVVSYTYDAWGAPLSVTGTAADTIGQINPFRYRSYYYDNEIGLYYLNSRYYDPETYRFLNADSILDNRGINTLNLFAHCGNNSINNKDPDGHFFFGTLIGGIIGGAAGAISAAVKGKSVTAGFLTGAATGAAIGWICDSVATGGMSAVVGVVLCGVAAGLGNAVNQYANYKIEKKHQTQSKNTTSTFRSSNTNSKYTPTSSNGKLASECNSFVDYVDVKSIAISSITAMVLAPVSIGANYVVNSAFVGVETAGATGFAAQFIANFSVGGNISILQSIIDLF